MENPKDQDLKEEEADQDLNLEVINSQKDQIQYILYHQYHILKHLIIIRAVLDLDLEEEEKETKVKNHQLCHHENQIAAHPGKENPSGQDPAIDPFTDHSRHHPQIFM